jgi:Holliday junction DNA helicase RuvB
MNFRLSFYDKNEIEKIISRSARLLGITIQEDALDIIARSSRFTPRIANRLLKRARDYAQINDAPVITLATAQASLEMLEIDNQGLDETDRKILSAIAKKFNGGPVGLKNIAASISEEEATIEDVYEPYLMQLGFLARTPKGRVITPDGAEHIKAPNVKLKI